MKSVTRSGNGGTAMPRDAGSISGARAASEHAEAIERPPQLVLGVSSIPTFELVVRLAVRLAFELKLAFEPTPEPEYPLSQCAARPRGAVCACHGSQPLVDVPKGR